MDMDSIFLLNEGDRASFLQQIMQSFACSYICLWSYFPQPSNCLLFMDGLFHEENNHLKASSSSGTTLSRTLFNEYQQSVFTVETSRVPGLAFKNSLPYIEFKEAELSRLATTTTQLQFYLEAGIKTAIFLGCKTGEIEIGISNNSQVNLEMEMKNLFPEDFSRQALSREVLLQQAGQNQASSSSSSLRSLSLDNSPDQHYSPFSFSINPSASTSYLPPAAPITEAHLEQALRPLASTMNLISPVQQAIQSLGQIRSTQFPTIESEEDAMTKAILAVISSSSSPSPSSSTASHHPQQNVVPRPTAFKSYKSALAPTSLIPSRVRRHDLFKRSLSFFRSISLFRAQGQLKQGTRPTSNQLHHMISERRRREKLNESFQALRSLLPPGSKRDKASVLSSTTDYLTSLKVQIEELIKKNQMLEAELPRKEALTQEVSESSSERLNVRITDVGQSTSEARVVDLQVNVRGETSMLDLVIRLLDFLKQVENVSLLSVEAQAQMVETIPVNRVVLRLRIQGGEWDEAAFQEAVRRVVADLAQ